MSRFSRFSAVLLLLLQCGYFVAAGEIYSRAAPKKSWFCPGNGADWGTDLWNDKGVGDWLKDRVGHYIEEDWPPIEGSQVQGVPRVIAEYGGKEGDKHDNDFNWGPDCFNVAGTCDLDEDAITGTACKGNEERAFALWAMKNQVRFVQVFYKALSNVFDTSALKAATIADSFIHEEGQEKALGGLSWLIIAQSILGAVGSVIPYIGPAVGIVSGGLGVGVAFLAAVKDPARDMRFTNFAALQASLGDVKSQTQSIVADYFDTRFRNTPPNGDADLGNLLADSLHDGTWAEQDIAEVQYKEEDLVRVMHSGIINEAWTSDNVVLVRWSQGKLVNDEDNPKGFLNVDPCWDNAPFGDEYLPSLACENDLNYVVGRMNTSDDFWTVRGFDADTLASFGLNHKIIIDNSEYRQSASAKWMDSSVDTMQNQMLDLITNPVDNIADRLMPFNLPVCDLDILADTEWGLDYNDDDCFGIPEYCLAQIVKKNCPLLLLGDNVPFPYPGFV